MYYLPYINEQNKWNLKQLNTDEKENNLKEFNLIFKEAFVGCLQQKDGLNIMVYDKDILIENKQGQKIIYVSQRRLKKFILMENQNKLMILDRGNSFYLLNLNEIIFKENTEDQNQIFTEKLMEFTNHMDPIWGINLIDEKYFIQGSDQGVIKLFDSQNLQKLLNVSVWNKFGVKQILIDQEKVFFLFKDKTLNNFYLNFVEKDQLLKEHFKTTQISSFEQQKKIKIILNPKNQHFYVLSINLENKASVSEYDQNFKLVKQEEVLYQNGYKTVFLLDSQMKTYFFYQHQKKIDPKNKEFIQEANQFNGKGALKIFIV